MEMYKMAVVVAPLNGVQDFYDQIVASPQRNYIFIMICIFIGSIFVIGIFFGRVTNRIRTEIKNR